MGQMGTTKFKNEGNSKLNNEHLNIIKAIREIGLYEAIEELNLELKDIENLISKNIQFKNAYYDAIGLSIKQAEFLKMFPKKLCNISQTCKAIGINRKTFYRWKEKNIAFTNEIDEINQGFYDDVESIIHEKIFKSKDTAMIIYFAKTKLKERGYSDKSEINLKAAVNTYSDLEEKAKKMTGEEMDARIIQLKEFLASRTKREELK